MHKEIKLYSDAQDFLELQTQNLIFRSRFDYSKRELWETYREVKANLEFNALQARWSNDWTANRIWLEALEFWEQNAESFLRSLDTQPRTASPQSILSRLKSIIHK